MTNVTSNHSPIRGGVGGGRLLSLDILRGMTVAGMIFVNNGYGESFKMFNHAEWNGMTVCDIVFPFFLFIMGVSTYLSLSKYNFTATMPAVVKILRRTVMLFFLGVFIHWFDHAVWGDPWCFNHLRIWAVLQRIALCYCGVSLFALFCNHKYTVHTIITLLVVYAAILIWGHGYENDSATNILARVDISLFGKEHLYTKQPIDPEGLVGTISGIAHALIGFYCGMLIKKADSINKKLISLFLVGTVLVFAGYLLSFGLPLNKRIWSPSYVLVTCGMASLLLGLLMYVIDVKGKTRWAQPFHVFGVNPLALYAASELLVIIGWRFNIPEYIYTAVRFCVPFDPRITSACYALVIVGILYAIGYVLWKRKIYVKL